MENTISIRGHMFENQIQLDQYMRFFIPIMGHDTTDTFFSWDLISYGSYSYSCSVARPFFLSQKSPYWCQWEYLWVGCRIRYEYAIRKTAYCIPFCFWSDRQKVSYLLMAAIASRSYGMTSTDKRDHGSEQLLTGIRFSTLDVWSQLNSLELLYIILSHLAKAVE